MKARLGNENAPTGRLVDKLVECLTLEPMVLDYPCIHAKGVTMHKSILLTVMFSVLFVSGSVSAADKMKPGLWSMTIKSDSMKNRPKIPAEQMEQMRKMGVNIPKMQEDGMELKLCMTKEMVSRDQPPMGQNKSGCNLAEFKRNGNTYFAKVVCDSPNMKGISTIKGSHSGLENFSWISDFKGTVRDHTMNTHQEATGKWLGPDCGDVKPISEHSQK
jgi:hypothetical protein